MLRVTFARSVEAETVDSVAQGRRTPFARRSLSFFQPKSLRALLLGLKEALVRTSVVYRETSIACRDVCPSANCLLSSTAAGFLQPFFKQSDEPPASRKPSVSKVSAEADEFND